MIYLFWFWTFVFCIGYFGSGGMVIIELHRTQTPFAVLVSKETFGDLYSILYRNRYIICEEMTRKEIRWFCDNRYLFRETHKTEHGTVFEYKKFKKKMSLSLRHNFLVRHNIIKGDFI